ncbi:uncharacterized protein LOC118180121 [Stegodyphus dumicola]|uniref:uncharacterized protein LOC118180121 n=1 Tax=Stegodyphus dumicola TaxID=202533 RepID=UPI0015B1665D|nr:uncharacterized protein LOC118180121 [Stegodyphus dumicola]
MSLLLFLAIASTILAACNGYSSSMSCVMNANGERICKHDIDPNGNFASSGAMTDGYNGQVFANANRQPYPIYPNSNGQLSALENLMRTVMGQENPYANRPNYPMNYDYYNYF